VDPRRLPGRPAAGAGPAAPVAAGRGGGGAGPADQAHHAHHAPLRPRARRGPAALARPRAPARAVGLARWAGRGGRAGALCAVERCPRLADARVLGPLRRQGRGRQRAGLPAPAGHHDEPADPAPLARGAVVAAVGAGRAPLPRAGLGLPRAPGAPGGRPRQVVLPGAGLHLALRRRRARRRGRHPRGPGVARGRSTPRSCS